jgi:hypothetical protein
MTDPICDLACAEEPETKPAGLFKMFAYSTLSAVRPVKLPTPVNEPENEPVKAESETADPDWKVKFDTLGLSILIIF